MREDLTPRPTEDRATALPASGERVSGTKREESSLARMLKLTRLNNHVVAINPDHIGWVDSNPDTTLCLISGEKIIVRETLEELIVLVVEFRRAVRMIEPGNTLLGTTEGDPPRVLPSIRRSSMPPSYRGGR